MFNFFKKSKKSLPKEVEKRDLSAVKSGVDGKTATETVATEEVATEKTLNTKAAAKKSFLAKAIGGIFSQKKFDAKTLEELEEALIQADISFSSCQKILSGFSSQKFDKNIGEDEIRQHLKTEILKILAKSTAKLDLSDSQKKPKTLIFNGVNGSGKTTTIGKIAFNLKNDGRKVLIAACDTYRAGAADQLEVWAKRSDCDLVRADKEGQDPASVAFKALQKARDENYDFLLIDTAGRLQNKKNLMDELGKINNVLRKIDENAVDENILVLDGTIGQNAKSQMEVFNEVVSLTGLIITKLDGTAKGGIAITLVDEFEKPIYAIGKGEKIEDLVEFDAEDYVDGLV